MTKVNLNYYKYFGNKQSTIVYAYIYKFIYNENEIFIPPTYNLSSAEWILMEIARIKIFRYFPDSITFTILPIQFFKEFLFLQNLLQNKKKKIDNFIRF